MKRLANIGEQRKGVAAVEFALTVPLLLFLIFGAYELARANMMMHTAEAAAYEGARLGIVPGANATEMTEAAQFVLATAGIRNPQITVTPTNLAADTDQVAVEISFSFKDNVVLSPFFMGDGVITRQCILSREKID